MAIEGNIKESDGSVALKEGGCNREIVLNEQNREEIKKKFIQWTKEGYQCSQILIMQFLELQGKTNRDLIRVADSLQGGLGFAGKNCGVMTAAACVLGLYEGRGPDDEKPHEELIPLVLQLVDWFEEKYGGKFGGIDCSNITEMSFDEDMPMSDVCTNIIVDTYFKLISLLQEFEIDLGAGRCNV